MGIDYCRYIGPYFQCRNRIEEVPTQYTSCLNNGCVNYKKKMNGKFCPACGAELGPIDDEPKKQKTVRPYEITEEIKEALFWLHDQWTGTNPDPIPPEYDIYAPNVTRDGSPPRIEGDNQALEVNGSQIEDQKVWLNQAFAKEREILQDKYGVENVEIKWGILFYTM